MAALPPSKEGQDDYKDVDIPDPGSLLSTEKSWGSEENEGGHPTRLLSFLRLVLSSFNGLLIRKRSRELPVVHEHIMKIYGRIIEGKRGDIRRRKSDDVCGL